MLATRDKLKQFDRRIIVAGSREYYNYFAFSECMMYEASRFPNQSICFISGKAKTGADALIIDWCKEFNCPWVEYPADWNLGNQAGYIRNVQMIEFATELIVFYDDVSKGTRHMIDIANKRGIPVTIYHI